MYLQRFPSIRVKRSMVKQRDHHSAAWREVLNDVREYNAREAQVAFYDFAKSVLYAYYLHPTRIFLRRRKKI